MGFMKKMKSRDTPEKLISKEKKIRSNLKGEKREQALKDLVEISEKYENIGKKNKTIKLAIEIGKIYFDEDKFAEAIPLFRKVGQIYLDHSKYANAAKYFRYAALSALKAEEFKDYQYSILLICFSHLILGELNEADKVHSEIYEQTGVSVNLEETGKIINIFCEAGRLEKFNKQLLSSALNLIDNLDLRESETKLAKKIGELIEKQAQTKIVIKYPYKQVWVGKPIEIKCKFDTPMEVITEDLHIDSNLFKIKQPKITKGNFTLEAIPEKMGVGSIGPIEVVCKDKEGRKFPVKSNSLKFTIDDLTGDIAIGIIPVKLRRRIPTEIIIGIKNSSDHMIRNLEFDFSFSEEIEVTLGVTNKKISDLKPSGILEIPLTIMGKKLGEYSAEVKYSYSDAKNQRHSKKGKVTLEVIRTKVKKKEKEK
ncbi:MAG: hypothetical protein ACTSUV_02845 [Candidatus Ranarchaeia archaeon]